MYRLLIEQRVYDELKDVKNYPAKVHRQITLKIFALQFDPKPADSQRVGIGYRVDIGEHRILYTLDDRERTVRIELIGPRNDDAIYRMAKRLGLL
jgi:mRNA interferase RelE/StbE